MSTTLQGVAPEFRRSDRRDQRVELRPAVGPPPRKRGHARTAGDRHLGEQLFREALVRERKNADRFGAPFAVLVVDRGESYSEPGLWAPVLRALSVVKRDLDTVGWLEEGTVLGLLLPETSGNRAREAMLSAHREIAARVGDVRRATLSIRLYAHAEQPDPGYATLPAVDLLIENFVPTRGHPWHDAAKRVFDILVSSALLLATLPVLLAIAVAVIWTSPGQAVFRQVRVGRRGEPFTMLKFRTMFANSDHAIHQDYVSWFIKSSGKQPRTGDEVFKLTNDPRITPVGRFLRKTSLDELPQFWNVLRGDMSLVGPRPPLPFEVERYQPWHRRRVLDAKPGVTGLWQVSGRSRTTFDEMVRLDLRYARTRSLWTDIKILAATPWAMLSGRGAC